MKDIFIRIRQRAREIVSSLPAPQFYTDHQLAYDISRKYFQTNDLIKELHQFVGRHLENDFGHGLLHAEKVAIDAGALMNIEGSADRYSPPVLERRTCVVQCAGLMHDIKRKQKNHSQGGAAHARQVLVDFPLRADEINDISLAIHNHEAFKAEIDIDTPQGALVSDCLYDADKFRWGPDNFTDTLWDMISFYNPPLSQFLDRYPQGMEGIAKIKTTFRTATGKKYGPQFIDLGLAIGEELYAVIQAEFSEYL